jgi:hypothetical protein
MYGSGAGKYFPEITSPFVCAKDTSKLRKSNQRV